MTPKEHGHSEYPLLRSKVLGLRASENVVSKVIKKETNEWETK